MSITLSHSLTSCEKAIIECLYRFSHPMSVSWICDNLSCIYSKRIINSALSSLYRMDCLGISIDKDWYMLNLHSVYVQSVISELCA